MTFDELPYPNHVKARVLQSVPTSYAWNWRSDLVDDLAKHGFVKIEHGGSNWSLTDKGKQVLSFVEHLPQETASE